MGNILFGKLGKSVLFDSKKWSSIGGDMEAPYTLFALARFYPEHTFWIISKNDYEKVYPNGLSKFKNIKNCWSKEYFTDGVHPDKLISKSDEESMVKYYNHILNIFKKENIVPDFGILLSGINFYTTLEFNKPRSDGPGYTHCLEAATKYLSYIVYTLNELRTPYINIVTDPRQVSYKITDLVNLPLFFASQIDQEIPYNFASPQYWKKEATTENYGKNKKYVYSKTELGTMLFRKPINEVKNFNKDWFRNKSGFNIIMNEGLNHLYGSPRYHTLKEYILYNPNFDCSIYGVWDKSLTEGEPRFKGPLPPTELGSVLDKTKYTFCISIDEGWITAKFIEMCHFGVIPFLHKNYASKVKSNTYIDPYFYVDSKEDLFNKISELESDENKYFDVVNKVRKALFEHGNSIYTGASLVSKIVDNIHVYAPEYSYIFDKKDNILLEDECLCDYIKEKHVTMDSFF